MDNKNNKAYSKSQIMDILNKMLKEKSPLRPTPSIKVNDDGSFENKSEFLPPYFLNTILNNRWLMLIRKGFQKEGPLEIKDIGSVYFFKKLAKEFNRIGSDVRQYCGHASQKELSHTFTMEKRINNGLGLLPVWSINALEKNILVNTALVRPSDKRYLKQLISKVSELKQFKVFGLDYGYPYYYNYGFNKLLPTKMNAYHL